MNDQEKLHIFMENYKKLDKGLKILFRQLVKDLSEIHNEVKFVDEYRITRTEYRKIN